MPTTPVNVEMSNISISSDLPTTAFTTTLKEEFVESASSTTENTPLPSPQRTAAGATFAAPSASASRPQIIIEDGSFLSSQFASGAASHSPSSSLGAPQAAAADEAMMADGSGGARAGRSGAGRASRKREGGEIKEEAAGVGHSRERRDSKRQRTSFSGPSSRSASGRRSMTGESNGADDIDDVGRHLQVMKYNQEALNQRKAQMGHFQQTLSATGGGGLAAPFPHLLAHSPTTSGSPASEVSNLRRQRVLEGLPEPINSFMCNVQWPEGVTYKKLSASGHVDYVQYNRISFFSGLSSCYEALECIDLSLYKQCRNGSTYVLPIGKCISYEDKAPHWLIMSIVDTDDPTLIIVNASPSVSSAPPPQPPAGAPSPGLAPAPLGNAPPGVLPAGSPSLPGMSGNLSASPQSALGLASTPGAPGSTTSVDESLLSSSTGDDASSFSDNLVAQYLSHFLAYLEPEPSDDKSGEEENRTYYTLEDAFDAVSTSARPTKTFRPASPNMPSGGSAYASSAYGQEQTNNSIFDMPPVSPSSSSSMTMPGGGGGVTLSSTDLRAPPTDGLPGHPSPMSYHHHHHHHVASAPSSSSQLPPAAQPQPHPYASAPSSSSSGFGIFTPPALGSLDDHLLKMQSGNVNPHSGYPSHLSPSSHLTSAAATSTSSSFSSSSAPSQLPPPPASPYSSHLFSSYTSTTSASTTASSSHAGGVGDASLVSPSGGAAATGSYPSSGIGPAGGSYSSSPYPVSLASASPSDHGVLERTAEATDSFKVLRLNLNKQYIPSLPPMIGRLRFLQTINLRRNHLQELPAEFGELRDLQYLTLSFNRLQRLPDTFGNLTNLRMLDLHSNKLTRLPDSFVKLGRLEYLTVSYNQLNSLPRGFGDHFHRLEFLNLENNQLSSPPSSEGLLMPMANEDDDGNTHSLVITPQSNFSSLITLRVGCNQLTTFPPGLCDYVTTLHELNLSRNQISYIPPAITNLTNLRLLYLGVNPIEVIPRSIGVLENLYVLGIHQTFIADLPEELTLLHNLETLYLRKNAFRVLPDVIFQMTMLRKLDLNFIRMTNLPGEIGQLTNLEILQLRETMIKVLPREITNLRKLTDLDLSLNNMTTVPEEVLELANLRTLEIMYNHLQTLPPELGNKLGRLKNLDVSHNKLTKLPPSIAKLVELRQLDLSCNKLPHIPEEVLRLPHLKFLSFGYNKLTNDEKKTLKKRFKD